MLCFYVKCLEGGAIVLNRRVIVTPRPDDRENGGDSCKRISFLSKMQRHGCIQFWSRWYAVEYCCVQREFLTKNGAAISLVI